MNTAAIAAAMGLFKAGMEIWGLIEKASAEGRELSLEEIEAVGQGEKQAHSDFREELARRRAQGA